MIRQSTFQVTRETDVMPHPALKGALEVQKVYGTHILHRTHDYSDHGRDQVRKSAVKSRLTSNPCKPQPAYAMLYPRQQHAGRVITGQDCKSACVDH
jgi:hypothetical protein